MGCDATSNQCQVQTAAAKRWGRRINRAADAGDLGLADRFVHLAGRQHGHAGS
jgi:hypothetical protein